MAAASIKQPFVSDSIRSRFGRGVLLCDPHKLNKFLKGKAKGRDLNRAFLSDSDKNVYSEGIAVGLFDHHYEECKVTVRDTLVESSIAGAPCFVSDGWILECQKGELIICSTDALMFWDPFEKDEDPQRYVRFRIPRGWYEVTVRLEARNEDDDCWEDNAEFILTRKQRRPKFNVAVSHADDPKSVTAPIAEQKPVETTIVDKPIDTDFIKAILSKFTAETFGAFIHKLFYPKTDDPLGQAEEEYGNLGDGIFAQASPGYADSLDSVFVLQYLPLSVFSRPSFKHLANDPILPARLRHLKKLYNGVCAYYGMVSPGLVKATKLRSLGFLINLSGLSRQQYDEEIFPQYERLVQKIDLHTPITLVGSYDSFMDFSATEVQDILKCFLSNETDGITIQMAPDGPRVLPFTVQTGFESGVLKANRCPYEPVLVAASEQNAELIREFEDMVRKDCSETKREKFLVAHATEIFGGKYDRIEAQILLRFPEIDIAGKERRMDLFMRNCISNDWELFEIKNPIRLIRDYRSLPVMVAEVSRAITQLKNYSRLLSRPEIKEALKQSGIEHFEPTLNLVIGRKPQISAEQWNWLKCSQDKDVRLFTYDDLVSEMKIRLADRLRIFEKLK